MHIPALCCAVAPCCSRPAVLSDPTLSNIIYYTDVVTVWYIYALLCRTCVCPTVYIYTLTFNLHQSIALSSIYRCRTISPRVMTTRSRTSRSLGCQRLSHPTLGHAPHQVTLRHFELVQANYWSSTDALLRITCCIIIRRTTLTCTHLVVSCRLMWVLLVLVLVPLLLSRCCCCCCSGSW